MRIGSLGKKKEKEYTRMKKYGELKTKLVQKKDEVDEEGEWGKQNEKIKI